MSVVLNVFEKHRAFLAAVVVLLALSSVSAVGAVPYMNSYTTPPSGWVQCAGFTNTVSKDIGSGFLSGCVGAGALRIKVWNSAGNVEEDIYSSGLAWSGSSISNGGTVRALVKTNIKVNKTASSVRDDEGRWVSVMLPPAFVATGTSFGVSSGGATVDASSDASSEYGVTSLYNCGSESGCSSVRGGLLDRYIAFYKPSKDYSAPAGWVECSGSGSYCSGSGYLQLAIDHQCSTWNVVRCLSCSYPFANCDPNGGCKTKLDSDVKNCGSCGDGTVKDPEECKAV